MPKDQPPEPSVPATIIGSAIVGLICLGVGKVVAQYTSIFWASMAVIAVAVIGGSVLDQVLKSFKR